MFLSPSTGSRFWRHLFSARCEPRTAVFQRPPPARRATTGTFAGDLEQTARLAEAFGRSCATGSGGVALDTEPLGLAARPCAAPSTPIRRFRWTAQISPPENVERCLRDGARHGCTHVDSNAEAASTISSGGSRAIRSTPHGPFRTSRRCYTTTGRCSGSMRGRQATENPFFARIAADRRLVAA